MLNTFNNSVFKPVSQIRETKLDVSSRNARDIVLGATALRDAMTERLKAARLARDAELALSAPPEAAPKPARRKAAAKKS